MRARFLLPVVAALAVFGAGTGAEEAQARDVGVHVDLGLSVPLRDGMVVYGDPGWLPWPWYAFPLSIYDDVYVIRRWPRRYRTNVRGGAVHGWKARRKARAARMSCTAARQMLRRMGYRGVRAWDCRGRFYGFTARRGGKAWRITLRARDGRITRLKRLR